MVFCLPLMLLKKLNQTPFLFILALFPFELYKGTLGSQQNANSNTFFIFMTTLLFHLSPAPSACVYACSYMLPAKTGKETKSNVFERKERNVKPETVSVYGICIETQRVNFSVPQGCSNLYSEHYIAAGPFPPYQIFRSWVSLLL